MAWKVILLGLVVGSQAIRIPIAEPKIKKLDHAEQRSELSHVGSHKPEHHEEYASAYPSYEFSYTVNDPHTHDYKGQKEKRHGDEVNGEYWLLQPNGKLRTVKYQADKHKGFTAHVEYTHHHDHKEPHHEEITKPVEEIDVEREPSQAAEVPDPVEEEIKDEEFEQQGEEQMDEKEQKEGRSEEKEEHHEEIHEGKHEEKHVEHKPHGPIHIEYYILHKYKHHHHHDEPEEKPEPKEEKHEEHHEPIKQHKPVPLEIFSKVHHPIHNEHHGHVTHKVHKSQFGKYNHDIPYKPLINYNRQHHKAVEHKSPLLHLSQINGEEEERYSEELSPIRVSEPQAERKHHVEHPPHKPLLRLRKPTIHRQHNQFHWESNRRYNRLHGKQLNTSQ